jgi:hypothetical protein
MCRGHKEILCQPNMDLQGVGEDKSPYMILAEGGWKKGFYVG